MTIAKVVQERVFFPYMPYLDSAEYFCGEMKRKEYVSWHDLFAAVTLLTLSVEALANTIGELVIPDFNDFESSSPKAKIRLICERVGVEFNRNNTPFVEIIHLLKVRNQLAHPKYKNLRYESKEMPLAEAQKHYQELGDILHEIEKSMTPEMAQKSLRAVVNLAQTLRATVSPKIFQSSSKRIVIDSQDFKMNTVTKK
ncbi:MAG TPA: hypothetical protein VFF74_05720 [Methylophilaceae bacterium]|nr:hypothetical protein [Methylophilaceae bacterium]